MFGFGNKKYVFNDIKLESDYNKIEDLCSRIRTRLTGLVREKPLVKEIPVSFYVQDFAQVKLNYSSILELVDNKSHILIYVNSYFNDLEIVLVEIRDLLEKFNFETDMQRREVIQNLIIQKITSKYNIDLKNLIASFQSLKEEEKAKLIEQDKLMFKKVA